MWIDSIIGPRTIGQLESSVKATELKLDQESMVKLDESWPGPGGEAPEAYAWQKKNTQSGILTKISTFNLRY